MIVDEYSKEIELLMICSTVYENDKVTMVCFLDGLNPRIAEVVKLYNYVEIKVLVKKAEKVERQLKARKTRGFLFNHDFAGSSNRGSWRELRTNEKKGDQVIPRTKEVAKTKVELSSTKAPLKGKKEAPKYQREIKCFKCQGCSHIASQCPNRCIMVILDNGDIESIISSEEEMPPLEGSSDKEDDDPKYIESPVGDALITRRALNIPLKKEGDEMHKEHLFHMRCMVQNKICSIIIDIAALMLLVLYL